jgi:membrane fusion protein, multidrug efflux system
MMRKRTALISFIGCFIALGIVVLYFAIDMESVTTKNAFVSGDPIVVTTQTEGLISSVMVTDTQEVKTGDVLVILDDFDLQRAEEVARFNLESRAAKLEQGIASIKVKQLQQAGNINAKIVAEIQYQSAVEEQSRTQRDFDRIQSLHKKQLVSKKALQDGDGAVRQSNLIAEQKIQQIRRASNDIEASLIELELQKGDVRRLQAEVNAARAQLELAKANVQRRTITAQVSGVVAMRKVNKGQRVDAGTALMQIIPISQLYVNANFKEDQLAQVRIGDPALLTSDFYGQNIVFHGNVVGMSGGTGAAFSVIPTVNASGNWIKVTQRVPVRIAINPDELKRHPLRLGLSMTVSIKKH